jgi:hypothetical protein
MRSQLNENLLCSADGFAQADMNHTSTLVSGNRARPQSRSRDLTHWYYTGAASVMLLAVLIGFQHFFLQGRAYQGRELTPQIRTLVIVHGACMTGWMLTFLIQTILIATRRYRPHMLLGRIAAVFAAFILVSGFWFVLDSIRLKPPQLVVFALTMRQFLLLDFYGLLVFAAFVVVGVWYRRRPRIHRPMMLLATVSIMAPAIGRIDALNALYQGTVLERVLGPYLGMLVLGAIFLLVRWRLSGTIDRAYAIGYGVLASTNLLTIQFARTATWDRFARFLLH